MKRWGIPFVLATAACGGLLGIGGDDPTTDDARSTDAATDAAVADDGDTGVLVDDPDASDASDARDATSDVVDVRLVPCTGTGSGCSKWIFVTNERFQGNLGGVAGADQKCQSAGDAFMPGAVWKAWIAAGSDTPQTRFTKTTADYVTGNGPLTVAQGFTALASASHLKRIMDESNQPPMVDDAVWTGAEPAGNAFGLDCEGWTSSSDQVFGQRGNAGLTDGRWTNESDFRCDALLHLYCVEQ